MNPIQPIRTPNFQKYTLEEAQDLLNQVSTDTVFAENQNIHLFPSGILEVNGHRWPLADIGLQSLCKRLKIPLSYALKIPLDLLANNVNRLLIDAQREFFVQAQHWPQMKTKAVTCFARSSYRPLPYRTLTRAIVEIQKKFSYRVEKIGLSPALFLAEVTTGDEISILPNDIFRFGGEIVSSENAWIQEVFINPFIFRLVCSNGLISKDKFDDYSFNPSPRLVFDGIKDLVESGLKWAFSAAKDLIELLPGICSKYVKGEHAVWIFKKLGRKVAKKVFQSFQPEVLSTRTYYDVINEITAQANKIDNLIKQRLLQVLAGEVLHMAISEN